MDQKYKRLQEILMKSRDVLQNKLTSNKGVSEQGVEVRRASKKEGFRPSMKDASKHVDRAKSYAKEDIKDSQMQPKPNLPKSELEKAKPGVSDTLGASHPNTNQRGVNRPKQHYSSHDKNPAIANQDMSEAGHWARSKHNKDSAKKIHQRTLEELKDMPKPNLPKSEQGVNTPVAGGKSIAGQFNDKSKEGNKYQKDFHRLSALDEHGKVLRTLRSMKKPNLPKSEEMKKYDPKTKLPGTLLDKNYKIKDSKSLAKTFGLYKNKYIKNLMAESKQIRADDAAKRAAKQSAPAMPKPEVNVKKPNTLFHPDMSSKVNYGKIGKSEIDLHIFDDGTANEKE